MASARLRTNRMKSTGRSRDPRLAVLVADDDARVRQGLREMIQFLSDAVVVGGGFLREKRVAT